MDELELLKGMPNNAVIRWTMHKRYTYTAMKVGDNWYTSATEANTMVAQIMSTADLARALSQELLPFELATDWKEYLG